MMKAFCSWTTHSVSSLSAHVKAVEHLSQEPELRIHSDALISNATICRVIDNTTLFVAWDHADPLTINVQLMNGSQFSPNSIEKSSRGFFITGLSRHVRVVLSCGRPFALIEWSWTRNLPPRASPNVYGTPLRRRAERVAVDPTSSEQKLRQIYEECFGVECSDFFDQWPHAAKGALRSLFLKKLGAEIEITAQLIENLSTGNFHDHFSGYWVQMHSMYEHLQHHNDWQWAAKHLVPPRRGGQKPF